MITLRPYQEKLINDCRAAFKSGRKSVLLVAPTGSGKTICFAYFASRVTENKKRTLILAHRSELLDQISTALTGFGVRHSFIAPGRPYFRNNPVHVASVFCVTRRLSQIEAPDIIIVDEAHHAISGSTWSKVLDAFPKALRIGVTATPLRLSGEGLDDIFDDLVVGPTVQELIDGGSLAKYRVFAPSTIQTDSMHIRGGDFVKSELESAVDKPSITGNAINEYRKLAHGKRALAFCVSIDHAKHVAGEFTVAGYRAWSVDGKMDRTLRKQIVDDYKSGKLDVLTSCDLISEGFDLPAIEVAIMLRPTASLGLWLQQCGRALRPHPGKDYALILDHAGNTERHGLPCQDREWSLGGVESHNKNGSEASVSVRICPKCFGASRSAIPICTYCGHVFEIKPREVEQKEGELSEVDLEKARIQKRREQGQAYTLLELIEIGKQRKYKKPYWWAQRVFQARQARKLARMA